MSARVDEIADGIFRISTFVPPEAIGPYGFTFNQFLITGDEPLLHHTGMRSIFGDVSSAVDRIVGLENLRWITFSHVESDECGAMNQFLAACPRAQVVHGALGVDLSLEDMADRPPRVWQDGEVLEIGGHALRRSVRQISTPHVPHNWEAQVIFEEVTGTLFSGDLGTQLGDPPPIAGDDLIERALEAEQLYRQTSSLSAFLATVRRLAELRPSTVAVMHGGSFHGDGGLLLKRLAAAYEDRFTEIGFATEAPGIGDFSG